MRAAATALAACCLGPIAVALAAATERPNFIFFFQDDQDEVLGGFDTPMPKARSLMSEGARLHGFTSIPVCCPSRVSLWSGRNPHNNKAIAHEPQGWCSEGIFDEGPGEDFSAAAYAKAAGYTTGLYGKYLNQRNNVSSIPTGWDSWFMMVHENMYLRNDFSVNGTYVKYGDDWDTDYLTTVLRNNATEWLRARFQTNANERAAGREPSPVFLTIADHAPHVPATPEPKYAGTYAGRPAPRPVSYDAPQDVVDQHHWLVRSQPPMNDDQKNATDNLFERRWETLRSVDDMIEAVWNVVVAAGEEDNTYVFLSADHGFHLGELRLAMHKCTQSDSDLRVPFLARGPGIPAGLQPGEDATALLIDLLPTWVELAGATHLLPTDRPGDASTRQPDGTFLVHGPAAALPSRHADLPTSAELLAASPDGAAPLDSAGRVLGSREWAAAAPPLDGRSLVPVLLPDRVRGATPSDWRAATLSEYWGLTPGMLDGDHAPSSQLYYCWGKPPNPLSFVCDSYNNTFALARFSPAWSKQHGGGDSVLKMVRFDDDEHFESAFNLTADPWNTQNLAGKLNGTTLMDAMRQDVIRLANCSGATCG